MSYLRVIPRDLFNESSLLKCLGRLALFIVDEKVPSTLTWRHPEPGDGYRIEMDTADGCLFCANLVLLRRGRPVNLWRSMNARDDWPLCITTEDEDEVEVEVFDADGALTPEFVEWAEAVPS